MVGRLRLWSGYVLFFYVVTHLLNHALGLISLRVLEAGRHLVRLHLAEPARPGRALRRAVRAFLPGAVVARTAAARCRLSPWEWTQWILGASIMPLGALHVVGTRVAHELYGVETGYPWVLASLVVGRLDGHRAPVLAALRRLDPCLHRPALRLAPAALVSHLAAGALCRRPAGAGGRHRRRRHRLARRRRAGAAAGLPRARCSRG